MDPQLQQLYWYVQQQFGQGAQESDIRKELHKSGWPADLADQAIKNYHQGAMTPPQMPVAPQKKGMSTGAIVAIAVGSVVGIMVVAGLILGFVFLNVPSLQTDARNTQRHADVANLDAAFTEFISKHEGQVPKSVVKDTSDFSRFKVCGEDCSDADFEPVTFGFYAGPDAIQFKEYDPHLTVPDTDTVYIVPDADCDTDRNGIGVSTVDESYVYVAFLYAIEDGASPKQQCLSL